MTSDVEVGGATLASPASPLHDRRTGDVDVAPTESVRTDPIPGERARTARRAWFGDVYERGIVGERRVALTFDDGPLEGATEAILDILKSHKARATFFVIGEQCERWPGIVERMAREGHLVANHTWSHSRYSMLRGRWYWRSEIERTDAIIRSIVGRTPAWFRPPMGVRTPINMGAVRRTDHACIMWTRRAMDGVETTADRIVDRLSHDLCDGSVLLLHDGRERASRRDPRPTIEALPRVIQMIEGRQLRVAPLDEMLGLAPYRGAGDAGVAPTFSG
jgi:peptidoglycan-N-acetylglucosamine deacetylase